MTEGQNLFVECNKPLFADLPAPLDPVFETPEINAPVLLHDGPLEVVAPNGKCLDRSGRISLDWLPKPRLRVRVNDFCWMGNVQDGGWQARVPTSGKNFPVRWTDQKVSGGDGAAQSVSTGSLEREDHWPQHSLDSVLFHVANGPEYLGSAVRTHDGSGAGRRRATIEAPPWRIILDAHPKWFAVDPKRLLKLSAGYAITHVGRLERTDGIRFSWKEADTALTAVGCLLSFARGAWTTPMLLVGHDAETGERHDVWKLGDVDGQAARLSWFNELSDEGFRAFGGLYSKLNNSCWSDTIINALHWFIVANKPDTVTIEGAIALQQAAFEVLAWTILVQDRKMLSQDGIQKLPASDQMRLMLSTCGIPLSTPGTLEELTKVAKSENWLDGPHATTEMRNAIVHASPKKRTRLFRHGSNARLEAWMLGQWYLELVLLRLFDYTGKYSNRLKTSGNWQGSEVEPVPWASG